MFVLNYVEVTLPLCVELPRDYSLLDRVAEDAPDQVRVVV